MTPAPAPVPIGVAFAVLAYGTFATVDALIKHIGGAVSVFEIGFFTMAFAALPAIFTKPPAERWRDTFRLAHPRLVHISAFSRTMSAILVTYAFVTIPLAEVYAIVFLVPVVVVLLSVLLLKETVNLQRWVLVLISFAGVMVVVRPGFRDFELGHLTALCCAFFSAIATTTLRMVSADERRTSLMAMQIVYALVFNAVLMLPSFVMPDPVEMALLGLAGILIGFGHLLLITATRTAPASQVAPMQYSQMVWGLVFGAAFFGEFPDWISLVGIAIVVAAGLANVFADGARARIAGRFSRYRARRDPTNGDGTKLQGPLP